MKDNKTLLNKMEKQNMRSFTFEQYKKMAERFNKKSFREKIVVIQQNSDILTLASDYNFWGVKVKDKDIQERLNYENCKFTIRQEWGSTEIFELIDLLNIGNMDL